VPEHREAAAVEPVPPLVLHRPAVVSHLPEPLQLCCAHLAVVVAGVPIAGFRQATAWRPHTVADVLLLVMSADAAVETHGVTDIGHATTALEQREVAVVGQIELDHAITPSAIT